MEIILAKNAGFCFGVKRALSFIERAYNESNSEPLYTLGPLIHNRQVIEKLSRKGIKSINSLDEAERGRLVIRSHGVGPTLKKQAEAKFEVIDATCPFVAKAQKLAAQMAKEGYQVVIFGDKNHPEVIGLTEWAGPEAIVVRDENDARTAPIGNKVALLAQTTQRPEHLKVIENVLKTRVKELVVLDTICSATRERQDAAKALAEEVDVMIVIGGKHSANTNKLVSICRGTKTPTYHIEEALELQPHWFKNADKVGVTAGASTPDWIIEEVLQRMAEFVQEEVKLTSQNEPDGTVEKEAQAQSSEGALEADFSTEVKEIRKGDILEGTVVQITENEVMVDIGGKSEGIVPLAELSIRKNITDPSEIVNVGDKISVMVLKVENEEGHPVLSKKRADRQLAWEKLEKALEEKTEIKAPVIEVVKGGVLVDVGIIGFVPASLLERGYVENLDDYLGKNLRLRVIELDREKNKVVLSQKAILDEEFERQRQATWKKLKVGDVVKGVVRRITDFGAFVDLGAVDGLLHVSEIAYGRVNHASDVLREGQEIEVKILDMDPEKGRISLSRKALLPDPWENAATKYPVGAVFTGKVLRIAPFGAFIELEPGVEGLVHISQLAQHHVEKVEDVVSIGDVVKVKVLSVDEEAKKISLSIKQAEEAKKEEASKKIAKPYQTSEPSGLTLGDVFGELFEEKGYGHK